MTSFQPFLNSLCILYLEEILLWRGGAEKARRHVRKLAQAQSSTYHPSLKNVIMLVIMLQLFASSQLESEEFNEMEDLANHMGLFLQKTNIIRDYLEDINEEPAPRSVLASHPCRLQTEEVQFCTHVADVIHYGDVLASTWEW